MPRGVKLLPVAAVVLLCIACAPAPGKSVAQPSADPANMTYRSAWRDAGVVTLTQGTYREPAAPGSAAELVVRLSDRRVFGTVGGRDAGAVVLVTETGGTGTFYDLALLVRQGNGWVNSDVVALSDRVDIHGLTMRDDRVVVEMTTRGPRDPMCCPTLRLERRYALQGDRLVAAGESPVVPPSVLVGPVWQWAETRYNNDTRAAPSRPEAYTVQFAANGTVAVRADCNQKGGTYTLREKSLDIAITHSTMAMCPEDSLEGMFVRDLAGVAVWFIRDGELYLDIKHDTGTMRLERRRE